MSDDASSIKYFNRKLNKIEIEKVYGEASVRFFYENWLGLFLSKLILAQKWISQIVGWYKSTRFSARKIHHFIENYHINMSEYEGESFSSFNDFFIRKFKNGAREFVRDERMLSSPCEARYYGWKESSPSITYPVKGKFLSAKALLGDAFGGSEKAKLFEGGPLLIARLCPVDYHRYHYPDDGMTVEAWPIPGKYYSVNPIALRAKEDIFIDNERRVAVLKTKNFGYLAYIEVGAVCVGRIVQSHNELNPFNRGDEKGYFLFGGSTVILLGEKGAFVPSDDICENTSRKIETYITLGDAIGSKP